MSFLLPLCAIPLSSGSTTTLDMVPPLKMHASVMPLVSIDVLAVSNSSVDFLQSNSNSLLWSIHQTQWRAADYGFNVSNSPVDSSSTMETSDTSQLDSFNGVVSCFPFFTIWNSCTTSRILPSSSDHAIGSSLGFEEMIEPWPSRIADFISYLSATSAWLSDVLATLQLVPVYIFFTPAAFTLMHAVLLLPCAGALFLIFDGTLAALGLAIYIARLAPDGHRRVRLKPIFFFDMCSTSVCACSSKLIIKLMICINLLSYLPLSGAVGLETPKLNLHDYFLPGVSRWDGMPFHDFRRVWWLALCAALGNISQDGWSLLQTARNQDLGSSGNPGTAGQAIQSQNRDQRLFGAILNYIEATSFIYRTLSTAPFVNDGRAVFNYLYEYGHLPYTQDEITRMENEWTAATISTANIAYTPQAVFKWADYVNMLGDKLSKTNNQKRDKYLSGFPASFDIMIVNERKIANPGSFLFPTNYPSHHPKKGTAHAKAGEADIDLIARNFYTEWARMVNQGLIKRIPHGMHGHRVASDDPEDEDESIELESANMTREAVNEKTVCGICGGLGHAGKVDGSGVCLTYKLGHRIPHEHLSRMQYPDGYNPPRFMHARDNASQSPRMTRNQRYQRQQTPPSSSNQPYRQARAVDDAYEFDPSSSDLALRIAAEALRLSSARSPNPRPSLKNKKRFVPKRIKARSATETEDNEDETEHEEGEEPEELAVSFADLEF